MAFNPCRRNGWDTRHPFDHNYQVANGTIACNKTAVDHGSTALRTIAPSAGYHITAVTVDGSSVGTVTAYNFNNVTSAHTITAVFGLASKGTSIRTDPLI